MLGGNKIHPAIAMTAGFVSALLSGVLAFLMIPFEAPIHETDAVGFIQPR